MTKYVKNIKIVYTLSYCVASEWRIMRTSLANTILCLFLLLPSAKCKWELHSIIAKGFQEHNITPAFSYEGHGHLVQFGGV